MIEYKELKSYYLNKALFALSRSNFARNLKFENLHKEETCYIFGNGASIKRMDLKNFSDKISIGCNNLFLHKDFSKLDCRYYQIPPPFIFSRFFKYYNKFQRNYVASIYREKINFFNKINFFTSIYNKLSIRSSNIYYQHHFGEKKWDFKKCRLDNTFSFLEGATNAMIGLAIYMGFKKAILVGLDYLNIPRGEGHFYDKPTPSISKLPYNKLFFKEAVNHIDLQLITLENQKSETIDFKSYSDYTGFKEKNHKNTHIVNKENLDILNKMKFYKIY